MVRTPATTLAGVAGKLDAVLREGESWEECTDFPWPYLRSAFTDLVRLGQALEPGTFMPGSERKEPYPRQYRDGCCFRLDRSVSGSEAMTSKRHLCGREATAAEFPSRNDLLVTADLQNASVLASKAIDLASPLGGGSGSVDVAEALTLWELSTPEAMAKVALELFGDTAVTAAAWCALSARCDGRHADYRFWFAVFVRLGGVSEEDRRKLKVDER